MKEIILSNSNDVALVDDEDYDRIIKFKSNWSRSNGSVCCKVKNKTIHLHRFILNMMVKGGLTVDHIDRNILNNQKPNLRKATYSQNNCNKPSPYNKSGYKGVWFCPKVKVFYARVKINKKYISLGRFITAIEAAKAYNEGAKKYHGEFAYLNIV